MPKNLKSAETETQKETETDTSFSDRNVDKVVGEFKGAMPEEHKLKVKYEVKAEAKAQFAIELDDEDEVQMPPVEKGKKIKKAAEAATMTSSKLKAENEAEMKLV